MKLNFQLIQYLWIKEKKLMKKKLNLQDLQTGSTNQTSE